jgi:hypothetical protein
MKQLRLVWFLCLLVCVCAACSTSSAGVQIATSTQPPALPSDQPLKITGTGTVIDPVSSCSTPATQLFLIVNPDGSAELAVDHLNLVSTQPCTVGKVVKGLVVWGTANPADGTVTFETCYINKGGVAKGKLTNYTSGILSGEVTCSSNGQPTDIVRMP